MTTRTRVDSWKGALAVYWDRRQLVIFLMGFSSGLPLLLGFSTLSWWLSGANIPKTVITGLLVVSTPYAAKFLWAPVFDHVRVPGLTNRLGRRRGWLIPIQIALMAAIVALGASDPGEGLAYMAAMAFMVAFFSASQDIVIDAYRIEILEEFEQGAGAAATQGGYRIGLLVAGAAPLALSDYFSWFLVYSLMASLVIVGMVAVLIAPEPSRTNGLQVASPGWVARLRQTVFEPVAEFCTRRGAIWVLVFILLYKYGDAIAGALFNPFFRELDFTGTQVALIVKTYGVPMTLLGVFAGGMIVARIGLFAALVVGGIAQAVTNLLFVWLAGITGPATVTDLFVVIAADNFTGGLGSTAFVAFLSALCNVRYTATQFALFTSLMALGRTYLAVPSGWLVDQIGWVNFFLASTALAVPALLLLVVIHRNLADILPPR
jgi:PAT family beta-lactamase induction signal transducer AmpG